MERGALLDLLDRAMGQVPAETRGLLVAHHVEGLPIAEASPRLGLTAGTAAVRLHRGREALRRLLLTTFREDAVAFGFVKPGAGGDTDLVPTRMRALQPVGENRSGPPRPGLLASGQLGAIMRDIQAGLTQSDQG